MIENVLIVKSGVAIAASSDDIEAAGAIENAGQLSDLAEGSLAVVNKDGEVLDADLANVDSFDKDFYFVVGRADGVPTKSPIIGIEGLGCIVTEYKAGATFACGFNCTISNPTLGREYGFTIVNCNAEPGERNKWSVSIPITDEEMTAEEAATALAELATTNSHITDLAAVTADNDTLMFTTAEAGIVIQVIPTGMLASVTVDLDEDGYVLPLGTSDQIAALEKAGSVREGATSTAQSDMRGEIWKPTSLVVDGATYAQYVIEWFEGRKEAYPSLPSNPNKHKITIAVHSDAVDTYGPYICGVVPNVDEEAAV